MMTDAGDQSGLSAAQWTEAIDGFMGRDENQGRVFVCMLRLRCRPSAGKYQAKSSHLTLVHGATIDSPPPAMGEGAGGGAGHTAVPLILTFPHSGGKEWPDPTPECVPILCATI
jgi:hypothetical protein